MLQDEIIVKQDWSYFAIKLDRYRKEMDDALNHKDYKRARKIWHEFNELNFEFYKSFCWEG